MYFTIECLYFTTCWLYCTTYYFSNMISEQSRFVHVGRNIVRIREIKGVKQDVLASALGISQQAVSKMEQSESIDDEKLEQIALALGVSKEAIKNFNEDAAINNINSNHTFNDHSSLNNNMHCNFNPIDKLLEIFEENKRLYERLLNEKDQIIELYKNNKLPKI